MDNTKLFYKHRSNAIKSSLYVSEFFYVIVIYLIRKWRESFYAIKKLLG